MVIIVVETWYPPGKAEEAGKKFLEVTKEFPEDKTLGKRILLCVRGGKDGMNTLAVWDIKKGKYEDALIRISTAMLRYTVIEGYRYDIRTYLSDLEALPIIGIKPTA